VQLCEQVVDTADVNLVGPVDYEIEVVPKAEGVADTVWYFAADDKFYVNKVMLPIVRW